MPWHALPCPPMACQEVSYALPCPGPHQTPASGVHPVPIPAPMPVPMPVPWLGCEPALVVQFAALLVNIPSYGEVPEHQVPPREERCQAGLGVIHGGGYGACPLLSGRAPQRGQGFGR